MGANNSPVQIQLTRSDGSQKLSMLGQATVCPQLVVIPHWSEGRYVGGFTLAHIPTGAFLPTPGYELSPDVARYVAALLAHLDWSSSERADYDGDSTHKAAWLDAVQAAVDADRHAEDERQFAELIETAEDRAEAGEPVARVQTVQSMQPAGGAR